MYVASRPAAIRALFPVPGVPSMDGIARQAQCVKLAAGGAIVDPQIDTGLLDAYTVNAQAIQGGYMTRPKIGESVPFCTPPGVSSPGIPNYNEFTFSIVSSLDPADYPANTEPDITPTLYVGARMNNDGDYNTQNSPEAAINPLTGVLYVEGDTVYEQKNTFTLFRNVDHSYNGGYFWHIQNAH